MTHSLAGELDRIATTPSKLALLGAGGHAKVVCSLARLAGYQVEGFFDDRLPEGEQVLGLPILGPLTEAQMAPSDWVLHISLGDNRLRARYFAMAQEWGRSLATLIHPSAVLDPSVLIGAGTVVMAGVVVNVDTRVGQNCILNTSCSLDHDCHLGDHVHLCPGSRLAGGVRVEEGAMLGTGASVIPGRNIGPYTTIGAGAAVVRDLPGGVIASGVPARVRRKQA